MSLLKLDGITIPVAAASPRRACEEIGSFARASNGAGITGLRSIKRSWDIITTPFSEADAEIMEAILLARGLYFPFNGSPNASNGYVAPISTNLQYPSGETLSDPIVKGQRSVSDVSFGHHLAAKALNVDAASSNYLTADTASFDAGIGTAVAIDGASLTRIAGYSIDAAGGLLLVETSNVVNGTRGGVGLVANGAYAPASKHTGSVYVMAWSGTATLIVDTIDANGVVGDAVTVTVSDTHWKRVVSAITVGGVASATLTIRIRENTPDSGLKFYVDCAQIEPGTGATKWMPGGSARATNGRFNIASATSNPFVGNYAEAMSMNFWMCGRGEASPGTAVYSIGATNYLWNYGPSTIRWRMPFMAADLAGTVIHYDGTWDMVTLVAAKNSDATITAEIWVNGVLRDTITTDAGVPFYDLGTATTLDIGSEAGNYIHRGGIAHWLFLPVRLNAAWIARLYNAGDGALFGMWPKHRATGNAIGGSSIDAFVKLNQSDPADFVSGGLLTNGRRVAFTLLEA